MTTGNGSGYNGADPSARNGFPCSGSRAVEDKRAVSVGLSHQGGVNLCKDFAHGVCVWACARTARCARRIGTSIVGIRFVTLVDAPIDDQADAARTM